MKDRGIEGQMSLFGSEPYKPNMDTEAIVEDVELNTEAEDFFAVGKSKKRNLTDEKNEKKQRDDNSDSENQNEEGSRKVAKRREKNAGKLDAILQKADLSRAQVVMQKSFEAEGKTATVAYIDYNQIYVQNFDGNTSLTQYDDSKMAVEQYLMAMNELGKVARARETQTHLDIQIP